MSSDQRGPDWTTFSTCLTRMRSGDASAREELLRLVYDDLRAIASRRMAQVPPTDTLQPTALVHEAWMRLADGVAPSWQDRKHFFALAAIAMHDVLVEQARRHSAAKRGGGWRRIDLDSDRIDTRFDADGLLDLRSALERLSSEDQVASEVVRLKFFAGATYEEVAQLMDLPVSRVRKEWAWAKVWLLRDMRDRSS